LLVAKTESDLQLFGNPLWVEIDSDLPENALAMAAGVTDKLWEIADVVDILEKWEAAN
jgi:hypothetical protein